MPDLRQPPAFGTIRTNQTRTVTAVFSTPTQPGSLVVVIGVGTHLDTDILYGPAGFTVVPGGVRVEDNLMLAMWYRPAAPSLSSVSIAAGSEDALQVVALEYPGMAQDGLVLDRVSIGGDNDEDDGYSTPNASSGQTPLTQHADEVIVAALANRYASTGQSGFGGGFALLSHTTTPFDEDYRRSRLTVHQAIQTQAARWQFTGRLTTGRDWVAVVATFRGGTIGPARMTSLTPGRMLTPGGRGDLTAFGPLRSTEALPPVLSVGGHGRIGPGYGQIRLGGWTGLLIGAGTPYRVESIEGLGGHDVRSSDSEFPRGDGAQRGVDLQAARQILIRVNFHGGDDPDEHQRLQDRLHAALVVQRSTDWAVMFRDRGRPLQQVWARPAQLVREQSAIDMVLHSQSVSLRAADPRIYAVAGKVVRVPVTPVGAAQPAAVAAVNVGNGRAFPIIRCRNTGLVDITTVELVNPTVDLSWRIDATVLPGAELLGDMPARVTAAPRPAVSIAGQSVYGAWVAPRDDFYIAPAPEAPLGANTLYVRTVPAGASIDCTVTYPDTWSN